MCCPSTGSRSTGTGSCGRTARRCRTRSPPCCWPCATPPACAPRRTSSGPREIRSATYSGTCCSAGGTRPRSSARSSARRSPIRTAGRASTSAERRDRPSSRGRSRASGRGTPHPKDHPAGRPGGNAAQRDGEVLLRDVEVQPGQPEGQRRQQRDGDLLTRAAVVAAWVAAALRNQVEGADLTAEEALRAEGVRVTPQIRVVVLAVQVEQHHRVLRDALAVELDVPRRPAADERRERVEPAHLVGECLSEGRVALGQALPVLGPANQCVPAEGHEPADRDGRPDDVEQFDSGDPRVQGSPPASLWCATTSTAEPSGTRSVPLRTRSTRCASQASLRPRARRARQWRGPAGAEPPPTAGPSRPAGGGPPSGRGAPPPPADPPRGRPPG